MDHAAAERAGGAAAGRRTVLGAALVALLVVVVYAPAARFEFVNYDDPRYVTGDPHVRAGLAPATIRWAFGRTHDNWHPLTSLSHAAVWQGWGGDPAAHHVVNVLLHAANGALVVVVLSALTGDPVRAGLVALLFALHPLRVESVAWVTERKDVLSGLGFLLTLWAYAAWVRRPSAGRAAAVGLAFVGALLAKPMVVTMPLVLLLLDAWPLARGAVPLWRRVREKVPLFALAGLVGLATILAQRHGGSMSDLDKLPVATRLANAAVAFVRYLGATVWPVDLAFFYPYRAWSPAVVAGAVVVLVLITAGVVALRRDRPYLAVGWWWWLVMLAPVSGIMQVGEQAMADRFTYLPSLGLFVAVVWGVGDLVTGRGRRLAVAGCLLVVAASTWATRRQLWVWQDSEALARHALAVTRDNHLAHLNLGQALVARGEDAEGRQHYEAGLRIAPDYPPLVVNRGHAALREGRPDEAEGWFRRALARRPDLPQAHHGLGRVAAAREDYPAAIAAYERALRDDPGLWNATADLADVLAATGRIEEAIAQYTAVVADHPTFGFELGNLLFRQGRTEDAIPAWRTALAASPEWPEARDNLAVALLVLGRPAEAIPELERVIAGHPRHHSARVHLGLALAAVGRREDAIAALRIAVAARPEDAEARRALADLEAAP